MPINCHLYLERCKFPHFMPKTHPHLEEVIEYESVLDIDALVQRALDGTQRVALEMGE